jgi:hypothetical protein
LLWLVAKAGLNHVPADGKVPDLGEQYRRLRAAAHTIELDVDVPVSAYLCTFPLPFPNFTSGSRVPRPHVSSGRGRVEPPW